MRGPEKLEGQFQSPCRFPDLRPGAPSSISPRSVGHRTRPFWHSVFLSSYMDLLANEQINYLKSISMLSCFSEPLQSVHDGSTKSCFRNTMARYDFTFFFHWGFMSVMTHRLLLLFCYERDEPCRQNTDQVSKDSMFKHNTSTVPLLRKRVNLLQCWDSTGQEGQEGFC